MSKVVSEEVMQELITKLESVFNNYCWNLEYFTNEEVEGFFDGTQQEINYYNSLIKDDVVSKNFLHSSKQIADDIAQSILEANEYTDSLLKNISSIQLRYVTSLPTSEISENTIYILKASDSSSKDTLNLYNATDGWTSIGEFTIDLTNYIDRTTYDTDMDLKANKTEVVANDKIVQTLGSTTNSSDTVLSTSGLQVEMDSKVDKNSIVSSVDSTSTNEQTVGAKLFYDNTKVSEVVDLISYVNTDLFDTTGAIVNVVKCGRNVQLNIQALKFKQDMEGSNDLLMLNAIPEEYKPLIMTETTLYTTTGNISGRGFLKSNGEIYNYFYYDSTKNSPKISGYIFGTFNYISAK